MLLGLCGAQGSGKTTAAHFLTGKKETIDKPQLIDPKNFVMDELYLKNDSITPLMKKYIDVDWSWHWCGHFLPISSSEITLWTEVGLADPLKRVCSILFNYPYHILLGNTLETRDIRERLTTIDYSISGSMTGRKLLQFFGTEMVRENLGRNFWANLSEKRIRTILSQGKNVVLSDIRFQEEKDMLKRLGGKLILISRDNLDNQDNHSSELHWQKFDYDFIIENNGSFNDFKSKIEQLRLQR
jgi:hypothetical protein